MNQEALREVSTNELFFKEKLDKNNGLFLCEYKKTNCVNSKVHFHNCYELEVFFKGKGYQQVDGKQYTLERGCVTLLSPSQIHYLAKAEEEYELLCFKIIPSAFNEQIRNKLQQNDKAIIGKFTEEQIKKVIDLYYDITQGCFLCEDDTNRIEMNKMLLNSFVMFIIDAFGDFKYSEDDSSKTIYKSIAYIKSKLPAAISLEEVAEKFGYTPSYFSYKFKSFMGKNFVNFVRDERLLMAYRQICISTDSIQKICSDCGFDSFSYFSRAFKQKYGVSPSKFRGESRKKNAKKVK